MRRAFSDLGKKMFYVLKLIQVKKSVISCCITGTFAFVLFMLIRCSGIPSGKGETVLNENENEEEFSIDFPLPGEPLPVSSFGEIWAYVIAGRENALVKGLPVSDIGYFGAEIDAFGKLAGVPNRQKLPFQGRVHLVLACGNKASTHFALAAGSAERKALIADLLAAAKNYDGLQIDLENVTERDRENFISFLSELRSGLGNKIFTIALAARTRKLANDVYDYERIMPLVDRILVMAYDEHWSTSKAGPVSSLQWCRRVAEYSLGVIGREKLVMGLPFYGRAWGDQNPSRALLYTTTEGLIKEKKIGKINRENGIPTFDYDVNVSVKVYYDDEYSLSTRMEIYRSMGIKSIGFWRLGQETPEVWKYLRLE